MAVGNLFNDLLKENQASNSTNVYDVTMRYLEEIFPIDHVVELQTDHLAFIVDALDCIRNGTVHVSTTGPYDLYQTYYLLLYCLKSFYLQLTEDIKLILFDHWGTCILAFLLDDIDTARNEILRFLELLGKKEESIVPTYDSTLDGALSRIILNILLKYAESLSRSKNSEDVREVMLVVEKIDPWLKALDSDMEGRTKLVITLMEPTSYADDDLAAERIAVTLLEHKKVCKDDRMVELGIALVSMDELWEKLEFLRNVLGHLDRKCQVVDAREPAMVTWATCLMQLQTYGDSLHPKICLTMQSIILNSHLEDILCDKGSGLLKQALHLIAKARASREENVQGPNDCVKNLEEAINLLHNCNNNVNPNERGSAQFLQAQALCLRALCHYELPNSVKNFSKYIGKALELLTSSDYIQLAAKYRCLSSYTTKLLYYVFDVLIMEHDENVHELLERIVSLFEESGDMRMLWQFKSHHNHLNIDYQIQTNMIDRDFAKDYNFLVEEWESIENLETTVSNIENLVPVSLKSRCRLAQLYFDLAERMLLMGSMTKALKYASEGLQLRSDLLSESLEPNTWHMDPVVAARVWSITVEVFILAPNINLICYLNSIYQEATILELIGSGQKALEKLAFGEAFSLNRGLSFYAGRFQALIGRINRKIQKLDRAKKGLEQAQEHYSHISCEKCKLMLQLDISKESLKQTRKNGLRVTETMERLLSVEHMLRKHLNTETNGKGPKNSNYRSKCWDRTCRLSLLSVLSEKGKEHVYANEKKEACKVFLENIRMVISLSSFPSSKPPTTLCELLKLVENKAIKVVHGTHIAELIYIICWVAYTEDESDSDFYISKEMLITTLKHALVLSSETPELFKKVAQLLAIMYIPKYCEETPKSENFLTHQHWACFFQQLTVGCGVNYLLSLRLSKVYDDCDADNILHRLTPRSDVDLSDFVKKFYNDLQPHTIVVMNVLGDKYMKFMEMFLPFFDPSECVACLMISRFSSTCVPQFKLFTVNSPGPGTDKQLWKAPWGTNTIVDTMLPEFKMLIKDYHTWSFHTTHDERLSNLLCHMESWLGPNKDIMLGEILEGQKNQKPDNLGRFTSVGVNDSSVSSITSLATKRAPVILVLDKDIQMLPWESMKILENQEIYRMPSVSSIFYTNEKCHKSERITVRDFASLDPSQAYYVMDPDIDNIDVWRLAVVSNNEFHLEGIFWKDVAVEEILEILKCRSLFIYVGHDDGLQYISRDALESVEACASCLLMGCSSAVLKLEGPYTPLGAPIDYLLAGSPIVMGNLWDIHQRWSIELTETLLRTFKERIEDEVGVVACLDLARNKQTPNLMYRAITICYGVPTLLQKRAP